MIARDYNLMFKFKRTHNFYKFQELKLLPVVCEISSMNKYVTLFLPRYPLQNREFFMSIRNNEAF